jgi:hypothetical protein
MPNHRYQVAIFKDIIKQIFSYDAFKEEKESAKFLCALFETKFDIKDSEMIDPLVSLSENQHLGYYHFWGPKVERPTIEIKGTDLYRFKEPLLLTVDLAARDSNICYLKGVGPAKANIYSEIKTTDVFNPKIVLQVIEKDITKIFSYVKEFKDDKDENTVRFVKDCQKVINNTTIREEDINKNANR